MTPQIKSLVINILTVPGKLPEPFSAFDVTQAVRKELGKNTQVPHQEVRDLVFDLLDTDPNFQEYTVSQPPNSPYRIINRPKVTKTVPVTLATQTVPKTNLPTSTSIPSGAKVVGLHELLTACQSDQGMDKLMNKLFGPVKDDKTVKPQLNSHPLSALVKQVAPQYATQPVVRPQSVQKATNPKITKEVQQKISNYLDYLDSVKKPTFTIKALQSSIKVSGLSAKELFEFLKDYTEQKFIISENTAYSTLNFKVADFSI